MVPQTVWPHWGVLTVRGKKIKARCLIEVVSRASGIFPVNFHKMALLKCPCAFRLRRLARNDDPGIGVQHVSCKFPHKMALAKCASWSWDRSSSSTSTSSSSYHRHHHHHHHHHRAHHDHHHPYYSAVSSYPPSSPHCLGSLAEIILLKINLLALNVGNGWEWGNGVIMKIVMGWQDHSLIPDLKHQ